MASKLPGGLPFRLSLQCPKCCGSLPRQALQPKASYRTFTTTPFKRGIPAPEDDLNIDLSETSLPPPSPVHARIVPASPSYFTARPKFTDDFLALQQLLRRNITLPTVEPGQAPRVAWKTASQYRLLIGEPVRPSRYHVVLEMLKRLNQIHPSMMGKELKDALQRYKRDVDPYANVAKLGTIDEDGKAYGIGRRKSSSAKVYLVQGNGEVLVNGKRINAVFGRVHDRESALWALKSTARMDKYNVWALVTGGGTTGQAEAIMLGAAKALMVHEPMLKPALRRGKCRLRLLGDVELTCLQRAV